MLYRYRYFASFLLLAIVLIGLLTLRTDLAPTGISPQEMQSTVQSAKLNLTHPLEESMIDLPYHLLQKASLSFFGITDFAIILPSILLGLGTGVAFAIMVRRWFRTNVSLITSLIFVTSSAFLTMSRIGTPVIMTTFWLSLILLAITNILHPEGKSKLWIVTLLAIIPLSLYTPLMIYPLIAILIAGLLHPHVRFIIRKMVWWKYLAVAVGVLILIAPLLLNIFQQPNKLFELSGIPTSIPSSSRLIDNSKVVIKSFLNLGNTAAGIVPQPIFGAASLIIIIFGLFRTVVDRYSARSYMLLIWSVLFIPLALLNPSQILICLVPAYLFMAIGVEALIREWYKLFPFNPYARLAGLLPLIILLGGIMLSNSAQYFYGYFYGTPSVQFKEQLTSTRQLLDKEKDKNTPKNLVVMSKEADFYDLLRRDYKSLNVNVSVSEPAKELTIVHDGASFSRDKLGAPDRIVTSYKTKNDQVILRIFRP